MQVPSRVTVSVINREGIPLCGITVYTVVRSWHEKDSAGRCPDLGSVGRLEIVAWVSVVIEVFGLAGTQVVPVHDKATQIAILGKTVVAGARHWVRSVGRAPYFSSVGDGPR